MIRSLAMCAVVLLLTACSKPRPPDKERPPEPQATQLRDAMKAQVDAARDVQTATEDAARAQDAAIEAAGG